jgi:hypothetical protein
MSLEAQDESARSGRIWDSTAGLWNALVMAFLAASIGVAALTYGALTPYDYWVGTPAKAKVERCEYHGPSTLESGPDLDCTGTWTIRGQLQAGPIKPPFRENDQNGIRAGKSVLDVRVHNGTAYTAISVGKNFYLALVVGAGALAWASFRLWKIWRDRRRPTT